MDSATTMPVRPNLPVLLARTNLERAQRGEPALSLRQLALECDLAPSVLTTLASGKTQRVDFATIDKLLSYFNRYITVDTGDLLVWTNDPAQPGENAA